MDNEEVLLPPGFKFSPSDEVLLVCYLMPQIYGEKLPCNKVTEKEIYGPKANPWHLFNASSTSWTDSGKFEKTVYVFTRLTTNKAESSSCPATNKKTEHYNRTAGCGTWHGETGRKQIMVRNGDNVISGSKKLLVYQINDIGGLGEGINLDQVGYWKMHEYSLDGFEDYVLCAITWDTSKKAKVVAAKTLSRSRSSTKRKAQSDTQVLASSAKVGTIDSRFTIDDSAQVGMNDPRLSSEKNSRVSDLGPVQDNYIVQEGSVNWMNTTNCTLPASTSCAGIVIGNDFFKVMDDLFTDLSEEELESYTNLSLGDIDEMLNDTLQDFSTALPSSPPDNNNDGQHPIKDSCRQALGKRKSTEAELSGLVQDNYDVVQEGSVHWMSTDCTLPAITSCPDNVASDGIFLGLEEFLTDFSEEEMEKLDLFTDFSVEEFIAALPSSPPDNNNDEQQPVKNYCSQALGKRKSYEAERSGKRLCI